jgi:hypothetical protein
VSHIFLFSLIVCCRTKETRNINSPPPVSFFSFLSVRLISPIPFQLITQQAILAFRSNPRV